MKYLWIKDHTHKKGHNIGNLFSNVFFKRCVYVHVCIYMYMHMCVHIHTYIWASLVTQMVKNLPAMQGIRVQSLGQEDPLEKGMATQSSILAWRIPWTEEPGGLQSMGSQRVGHNWVTNTHIHRERKHKWHKCNWLINAGEEPKRVYFTVLSTVL